MKDRHSERCPPVCRLSCATMCRHGTLGLTWSSRLSQAWRWSWKPWNLFCSSNDDIGASTHVKNLRSGPSTTGPGESVTFPLYFKEKMIKFSPDTSIKLILCPMFSFEIEKLKQTLKVSSFASHSVFCMDVHFSTRFGFLDKFFKQIILFSLSGCKVKTNWQHLNCTSALPTEIWREQWSELKVNIWL